MLLSLRIARLQPTRKTVALYLCGPHKTARGSSTLESFAHVAQPRNLDWLGPGS
jgi:hypothetical protein